MNAFPHEIIAAPMAGISSRAFREIVRSCGADLAYGEMISARALGYGNKKTRELMDIEGEVPEISAFTKITPDESFVLGNILSLPIVKVFSFKIGEKEVANNYEKDMLYK